MTISDSIKYVGVNDHKIDLFEGHYSVPNGISYNSYVIIDEKIAVLDTVDKEFTTDWLSNISYMLRDRKPDYLIVNHMEPDHSAGIIKFIEAYPDTTIVSSEKAFAMMNNFFKKGFEDHRLVVSEGDTLKLGQHTLSFVVAPMVHWPEVIMTYDSYEKVLFSADAFGKFGALDIEEDWTDEARRYYIGIVGKYGVQVQNVLKKAKELDIKTICPLHGPVLSGNLSKYLNLYNIWSSYEIEEDGIQIAYTSVYGNTKKAVEELAAQLKLRGCKKIVVNDLARTDMALAVANAFKYGKTVLATTTYNADIFPYMREFITWLTERGYKSRTIGIIENGSWAPQAAKVMKNLFANSNNITFTNTTVSILSSMSEENKVQINKLADELVGPVKEVQLDPTALFKIGYGLYVITTKDGDKDNGLIVNTVTQVTNTPNRVAVCINKQNYSHDLVKQTGKMNVNCLSKDAPFSLFQNFGFQSGRTADKFANQEIMRSENGLVYLPKYTNAFFSLEVEQYVDLGTHGLFICNVTEAKVLSSMETMTYNYYQENVKPKPAAEGKKGWVCKVCGYVYDGDKLPEDFTCPLCKHGPADFERIK